MGQEISVKCQACKKNKAVYKDVFEAECLNFEKYYYYKNNYPPIEKFLGSGYSKYEYSKDWDRKEIFYWIFLSCEECIENRSFSEYNANGVTVWLGNGLP